MAPFFFSAALTASPSMALRRPMESTDEEDEEDDEEATTTSSFAKLEAAPPFTGVFFAFDTERRAAGEALDGTRAFERPRGVLGVAIEKQVEK